MKKFLYAFTIILLSSALSNLKAQNNCAVITVDPESNFQTGIYRVKVSLDQSYDQQITVNGVIRDETNLSTETPFSVTVPVGNTTAATDYFFEISPEGDLNWIVNTIAPSIVTKNGVSYGTQGLFGRCPDITDIFDNKFKQLGLFHNSILLNVHSNLDFGTTNNYSDGINLIRDYIKNQFSLVEQTFLGTTIDVNEKNQMFEDLKYQANYSDFHSKLLATTGAFSIDVNVSNLDSLLLDNSNKQLIVNISTLIKANLNGTISKSNYDSQLSEYADQWSQINSASDTSLGAQLSGIILTAGLKSFQFWDENPEILYDDEISFDSHSEVIEKKTGPNINNTNLNTYFLPVPVGMDIAGAFVGTISSAVTQYTVKKSINMDMVYAGALAGAVTGSTGIVGRVGRFLSSFF